MRLGAMLVRDGRLTSSQVLAAVGRQARVGGRLGTVLVEMRLIDPDTLTVYLGLEMGIPIATRAALDRAKRTALRVLPPDQAERFVAVPLIVQDHQLIIAMRDPHDLIALDELAQVTGYRIIPRVAPEIRLYYYIERYYGIPRPARFRALGDAVIAGPPLGGDVPEPPPPPLPGLPPAIPPVTPPTAPAEIVSLRDVVERDELASQLDRSPEPSAPLVPLARSPSGRIVDVGAMARAAVSPLPGASQPSPASIVPPDSLDLESAMLRMTMATTRTEIADALLGYARSILDAAVILVVREELAFGWKGFGPRVEPDRVETLLVPLETSSMFRAAIDAADVFATSPPASSLHGHVLKVLRAPWPTRAVVAPVTIKERVVNLLYGQVHEGRTLGDEAVDGLKRATVGAANAYVRLIALHKQAV